MATVFTKIVRGEISSFKIAEDENHLAFLDAFPLAYGHVLVIPKKETDYIFDISSDAYLDLFRFAQQVAKAMDKVIVCKRIGIAVVGLEVPHAHIHLVPLNSVSDINFQRPKLNFSEDKMKGMQAETLEQGRGKNVLPILEDRNRSKDKDNKQPNESSAQSLSLQAGLANVPQFTQPLQGACQFILLETLRLKQCLDCRDYLRKPGRIIGQKEDGFLNSVVAQALSHGTRNEKNRLVQAHEP